MKRIYSLIMMLAVVAMAVAQQDDQIVTVNGFSVAGDIDPTTGTAVVIGQTFSEYVTNGDNNVTLGIGQSQLVTEAYTDVIQKGEEYDQHGFYFPSTTPAGSYNRKNMVVNGAQLNYDLQRTLHLVIEGPFDCGDYITDGTYQYGTVQLGNYCWMQENLRSTEYAIGGDIAGAMVYVSDQHPDEVANEETYGRLYTWYAAVNIPEGRTLDNSGFVQGACPDNWHIPTAEEIGFLRAQPIESIRSTELWTQPNNNNNSTDFTALPAGQYNPASSRFEGMGSMTDFWSVLNDNATQATSVELPYYCDSPMLVSQDRHKALSVRCVRNY